MSSLEKVLAYLDRLKEMKIYHRLEHLREAIMVEVVVPGERWEVEFFADGHIEFERFVSDGDVRNLTNKQLNDLLMPYIEDEPSAP